MTSKVTNSLIQELQERDAHGERKYGTTLDRTDLTVCDWIQHAKEEALDKAGYLEALKRKMEDTDQVLLMLQIELGKHGASKQAARLLIAARKNIGVLK